MSISTGEPVVTGTNCVLHPFKTSERLCSQCGNWHCNSCLVTPWGPKGRALCVSCALLSGGVRKTAGQAPARGQREVRRLEKERAQQLKAERKGGPALQPITAPEGASASPSMMFEVSAPQPAAIHEPTLSEAAGGKKRFGRKKKIQETPFDPTEMPRLAQMGSAGERAENPFPANAQPVAQTPVQAPQNPVSMPATAHPQPAAAPQQMFASSPAPMPVHPIPHTGQSVYSPPAQPTPPVQSAPPAPTQPAPNDSLAQAAPRTPSFLDGMFGPSSTPVHPTVQPVGSQPMAPQANTSTPQHLMPPDPPMEAHYPQQQSALASEPAPTEPSPIPEFDMDEKPRMTLKGLFSKKEPEEWY